MMDSDLRARKLYPGTLTVPPPPGRRVVLSIPGPPRLSVIDLIAAGVLVAAVTAALLWVSSLLP